MSEHTELERDQADRAFAEHRIDVSAFLAAGAGTGKTSTLVSRVMQTLLDGVTIEQIVAITFTERAGAELRHRLRTELDKRRALPEADPSMQLAYDHLDSASVGTIHAFARRILSRFALEAGLPMGFTVADEVQSSQAGRQRVQDTVEALAGTAEAHVMRAYGVQVAGMRNIVSSIDAGLLRVEGALLTEAHSQAVEQRPAMLLDAVESFMAAAVATCGDPDDKLLLKLREQSTALREFLAEADIAEFAAELAAKGSHIRFFTLGNIGSAKVWGDAKAWRHDWQDLGEITRQVLCGPLELALRGYAEAARAQLVAARECRRTEGLLEFDDLLWLAAEVLEQHVEVRSRLHDEVRVMLIDEFQDTDPLQWRIICRITADPADPQALPLPGRVVVVGDPKQAIYSFRGADIGTYEAALRMFEAGDGLGAVLKLRQNFRTVAPVIGWVNELFSAAMAGGDADSPQVAYEPLLPKHDPQHPDPGPAVTVLRDPQDWVGLKPVPMKPRQIEARLVARAIARAASEGWQVTHRDVDGARFYARPAAFRDVAILFPTRGSLDALLNELDAASIPYRSSDVALVFDRPVVLGVIAALRAISDPHDQLHLWLALKSPLYGCTESEMLQFVAAGGRWAGHPSDEVQEHRVGAAIASLRRIGYALRTGQPVAAIDAILDSTRIFEVLAQTPRGTFDFDCLRMLRAHAQQWQNAGGVGIADYNDTLSAMLADGSRVKLPAPDDRIDDAVQLLTVHAAKGLEFPIVVMAGMTTKRNDSTQALLVDAAGVEFSLGGRLSTAGYGEHAERRKQVGEAERMRVLYVAATRARDHLIVSTCGESGNANTSAAALIRPFLPEADLVIEDVSPVDPVVMREPAAVVALDPAWLATVPGTRARSEANFVATPSRIEAPEALGLTPTAHADAADIEPSRLDVDDVTGRMVMALRDGKSYGQAMHAAMDAIVSGRFAPDTAGIRAAAEAGLAAADGEVDLDEVARSIAAALAAPVVAEALLSPRRWCELYLAAPVEAGSVVLVEGIADLVFEDAAGSLVVVDYKTDQAIKPEARAHYADQLGCYAELLRRVTGKTVHRKVIVHVPGGAAAQFEV